MFWIRRKKIERLERKIQALYQRVDQLVAALSSHQPAGNPGDIIGKMLEVQGQQFESAGNFLKTINEIAVERASSAMGRRGGKARAATAKRDYRGRMLPKEQRADCPLCDDPMTANFSMAQWSAHQGHTARGRKRDIDRTVEAEADRGTIEVNGAQPHEPQPNYPLPIVVPNGDAAAGPGGDLAAGDFDHGDHIHKADGSVVRKADLPGLH